MELVALWLRRDLRLEDNTALYHAIQSGKKVLPVFIFDQQILSELPNNDPRVSFIYDSLADIHIKLKKVGSSLCVRVGTPLEVWEELMDEYSIKSIYVNEDYEPYAIQRDESIKQLAISHGVEFHSFIDQVVFHPNEVLKPSDGKPYTIYTPYKNKWLEKYQSHPCKILPKIDQSGFHPLNIEFPSLESFGFSRSAIKVRPYDLSQLDDYESSRDIPAKDATSYLSVHLRFGTVSIRQVIHQLKSKDKVFLSELIWREFFMQILYHFPDVVGQNFKSKYDGIEWRNDENDFEKWKNGETGYPMVDAGMRQLNETGYMHNRVRMVVASFLCKHLLIDWRWGEAYFAEKLLDYELSSNNGNWQWSAGTGCDAAPYFRVFNPSEQLRKFDPKMEYTKKWVTEFLPPIVDHSFARKRALEVYKAGINSN
ncbi:cryptochrome/photolyase family protein [Reichenbachiella sp.]